MKRTILAVLGILLMSLGFSAGPAAAAHAKSYTHYVCYAQTDNSGSADAGCAIVSNTTEAWSALHGYESFVADQGWYDAWIVYSNGGHDMDSYLIVLYERHTKCDFANTGTWKSYRTGDIDGRLTGFGVNTTGIHGNAGSYTNTSNWARGAACDEYIGPYGGQSSYFVHTCESHNTMPYYQDQNNNWVNLDDNLGPVLLEGVGSSDCNS